MEFKAQARIAAPASTVWQILTDGGSWPEWDPACIRIEGTIKEGNKIKVFTKLSPKRAFPVKVAEWVPNERMVWTGGMPFGLFKGVRTFTLDEADGHTDFVMHEVFSGPLLGLIGKSIPDMSDVFTQFAQGLKTRAEQG